MHTVGGMDHRQCRTGDRSLAVDTGGVCRTAHDTRHPPCRLVLFTLILTSLCSVLGCQKEPHPRAELVGLWESNEAYLFVVEGSRYPHFTSLAMLRSPDWRRESEEAPIHVHNQLGRSIATLSLALDPQAGVDALKIVLASGEMFMLQRRGLRELALLKSLGMYTHANYGFGILYPDGIFRLLLLYIITMIIVSNFVSFKGKMNDPILIFMVAFFLPILVGYLFGIFKWIVAGWWDPLHAGRVIIYASTVMLLAPALSMLDTIQNSLRFYVVSQPVRIMLFCLFLLCEATGLLVNVGIIIDWFK